MRSPGSVIGVVSLPEVNNPNAKSKPLRQNADMRNYETLTRRPARLAPPTQPQADGTPFRQPLEITC
jgi:hypothetical protein